MGGSRATLSFFDLSGLDLAGRDLAHADFVGSSLRGANLSGARLDCAAMFACDLRQANLENASLIKTDLRGACLRGAILIGVNLFESDLRDGTLAEIDRSGNLKIVQVDTQPTQASGADLSGANLTNARLSGAMAIHTDVTDAVMRGCKLVRATMRGANFSGSNLEGADLSGADLRGACLRGAVLTGASMTMTETAGADMEDMLTDQPVGRPVSALGQSLDELARNHMAWIGSAGAEGAKLDLSGYDLRGSPRFPRLHVPDHGEGHRHHLLRHGPGRHPVAGGPA
jgi:uncharacterized protein YjbI with pentapeptide repeats